MTRRRDPYAQQVFVNCPFDNDYKPLFQALIFCVADCGFVPRCALEVTDSGEARIEKIFRIIGECKLALHDISRVELDKISGLPRFNMPFEFGAFLGARRFGSGRQKAKSCLVLDVERYRFQRFLSDIAGQDIAPHGGDARQAVRRARDWLQGYSSREVPGGAEVWRRFESFQNDLPVLCAAHKVELDELTFIDRRALMAKWLRRYP